MKMTRNSTCGPVLALLLLGVPSIGLQSPRFVRADDVTWTNPAGGDWEDPLNWSGDFPNAIGDAAIFDDTNPAVSGFIRLNLPVTVGRIESANPNVVRIIGPETLTLDETGDDATANLALFGADTLHLSSELNIVDTKLLVHVADEAGTILIDGTLGSTSVDVIKQGPGTLSLDGDQQNWSGPLLVESGLVSIAHEHGLGSGSGTDTDATTILGAGRLHIRGGLTVSGEKFRLNGGTILGDASPSTLTIGGPLELLSDSELGSLRPTVVVSGPISGPGGLTIRQGDVHLNAANSYEGLTTIDGGNVRTSDAMALGSAVAGTLVQSGELRVDAAAAEPITVQGGELKVNTGSSPYTGGITLSGGRLGSGSNGGTVGSPLDLQGPPETIVATSASGPLTLQGGSTGAGLLRFSGSGRVNIEGSPLAHDGNVSVDQGNVYFQGANVLTSDLIVNGGRAHIAAPTNHSGTTVNGGRLLFEATGSHVPAGDITVNTAGDLLLDGPIGNDSATHRLAPNSVVLDGGTVTVAGSVDVTDLLSDGSTGGVVALNGGDSFFTGSPLLIDFDAMAAGDRVHLGATVPSTLSDQVQLTPDALTDTLRLGGPSTLTIDAIIADVNGTPTHVSQGIGGTTVLAAANTYTGETTVNEGVLLVTHAMGLGSPTAGTTIHGGTLLLTVDSEEPFTLASGNFCPSNATITGPLIIPADNTAAVCGSNSTLMGGATGQGSLRLSPTGTLGIAQMPIDVDGEVLIQSRTVAVEDVDVLNGQDVVVDGATLRFAHSDSNPSDLGTLTLRTGTVTGLAPLQATQVHVQSGTISVPITGPTTLRKTTPGIVQLVPRQYDYTGETVVEEGTLRVSADATLGTTDGPTIVRADGVLELDAAFVTIEPFELDGGTVDSRRASSFDRLRVELNGPIELSADSRFEGQSTSSRLNLFGTITGPAGIEFDGGNVRIDGENSYEGATTISAGRITVLSSSGLGSTEQGTEVLTNGELYFEVASAEPVIIRGGVAGLFSTAAEPHTGPVTLGGGTLQLAGEDFVGPVTIEPSAEQSQITGGHDVRFLGGTLGVGNVHLRSNFEVDQQPLAHQGDLIVGAGGGEIELSAPNTYTGSTHVAGGRLIVNDPNALGVASTPVEVAGAELYLNVSVDRDFHIGSDSRLGLLVVPNPDTTLPGSITLESATIRGVGTFDGPIRVTGGAGVSGTFNGPISGHGGIGFFSDETDDTTAINGDNTYQGITQIGRGTVNANHARALGSPEDPTIVTGGVLNVNVVTDEPLVVARPGRVNLNVQLPRLPRMVTETFGDGVVRVNVPSVYNEDVDLLEGTLEINADTTLGAVTIRGGGGLRVGEGATATMITPRVELQGGSIQGRLAGVSQIVKTTRNRATLGPLPGYDGEIVLEKGFLTVESGEAFGTSAGPTRLTGSQNAQLTIFGSHVIEEEIFLNNARGMTDASFESGAIWVSTFDCCDSPEVTLDGSLHLGDVGSVLSGSLSNNPKLRLAGPVTGGSLVKYGERMHLLFVGNQYTYTGATDLRSGSTTIDGAGHLSSTSEIVLHDETLLRLAHFEGVSNDRIADHVPVELRGGFLQMSLPDGVAATETLGTVRFAAGKSRIGRGGSKPPTDPTSGFVIGGIERQPQATGHLETASNFEINVLNRPPLDDGILPWLTVEKTLASRDRVFSFVTYDEGRIEPFTDYVTALNVAGEHHNVSLDGDGQLNTDAIWNSLRIKRDDSLDLGGNLLTLASGGLILHDQIHNGQLTAGDAAGAELIVSGALSGNIAADIVDNPHGSVHLTFSSGESVLSGNNTYTGSTTINGAAVILLTETALPAGTDLTINGGELEFRYASEQPKHLSSLKLTGNGEMTGSGGTGPLQVDELQLESGIIGNLSLAGDGRIVKTTDANAQLRLGAGSSFHGEVVVLDGLLAASGPENARFTVQGGTLQFGGGANPITLAGGELILGPEDISGQVEVTMPSRIVATETLRSRGDGEITGTITGPGSLVLDGRPPPDPDESASDTILAITGENPDFSGEVHIESTTVQISRATSLGTGDVTIHPGGRLELVPPQFTVPPVTLQFDNRVRLEGGELWGLRGDDHPDRITGTIVVQGDSRIGSVDIFGDVFLTDQSRLTTMDFNDTQFAGTMFVGGTAELAVGRTEVSQNAIAAQVSITGTIASDATEAQLNIEDRVRLDELVLHPSIHVREGQSLQIRYNGEPRQLVVAGPGKSVSGGGTLQNDLILARQATLSPGDSTGTLHMAGNLTFSGEVVWEWEINDALGTAGGADGWDLLAVDGSLLFADTAEASLVLQLIGLDASGTPGAVANFDPTRPFEWRIGTSAETSGFVSSLVQIDATGFVDGNPLPPFGRFALQERGGDLFLHYQIPEPGTLVLLVTALSLCYVRGLRSVTVPR